MTESDDWDGFGQQEAGLASPDRKFFTFTMKAGGGYEAPWLVFNFNSIEEAFEILTDGETVGGGSFQELEDLTLHIAKRFQGKYSPAPKAAVATAKPSGNSSGFKPRTSAPAPSGDMPSGTCPVHNCDLVYVEQFVKRDGSKINARVACPVPKCYAKTIWQNDDGSWKE